VIGLLLRIPTAPGTLRDFPGLAILQQDPIGQVTDQILFVRSELALA
jgi:hypothetical protein